MILSIIVIFFITTMQNYADEKKKKFDYTEILTDSIGSFGYQFGLAIAVGLSTVKSDQDCDKEICARPILMRIYSSQSDRDDIDAVLEKEADTAFILSNSLHAASLSPEELSQLSIIAPIYRKSLMVITHKADNIKNIKDLRNKKIFFGLYNNAVRNLTANFLSHAGLLQSDYNVVVDSETKAFQKFINHDIDALILFRTIPDPLLIRLSQQIKIEIIGFRTNDVNSFKKDNPTIHPSFLPARYYGNNSDVKTIGLSGLWITHRDHEKEFIHHMTKNYWQHMRNHHFKNFFDTIPIFHHPDSQDKMLLNYHVGALEFYKTQRFYENTEGLK